MLLFRRIKHTFALIFSKKMSELTISQKKEFAKKLYLTEQGITQKEIAERVCVSAVTINKWIKAEKWEELSTSLLLDKDVQLSRLYRQLKQCNDHAESKDEGAKFLNSKEADALIKITAAIKNLETETNIAEKMDTGKEFLHFVRKTCGFEFSKEVANVFNSYIKSCM